MQFTIENVLLPMWTRKLVYPSGEKTFNVGCFQSKITLYTPVTWKKEIMKKNI